MRKTKEDRGQLLTLDASAAIPDTSWSLLETDGRQTISVKNLS
jgi:hypothetical protein